MPSGDSGTRALGALLLCAVTSCAKPEPKIEIPPPIPIAQWAERVDTLAGTYTMAGAPIEFGDSIVIVADGKERTVYKIDLRTKEQTQFGSKGDGPGEYRYSGTPVKVHGDSIALLFGDWTQPMPILSVATGRGRSHHIPVAGQNEGSKNPMLRVNNPIIMWADTVGNVYGVSFSVMARPDPSKGSRISSKQLDTLPIVRYGLQTGKTDTVALMPRGVDVGPVIREANGATTSNLHLGPYGAYNGWSPLPDGTLLLANAADYKLKFQNPNGEVVRELQIASNAIPVSKSGWDAYVAKTTAGYSVELENLQKETFAKMGVAPPKPAEKKVIVPEMPRTLPRMFFSEGKLHMFAHNNTMWIPVHVSDPPTNPFWDLIDMTTGARLQTLSLPDKQYLRAVTPLGAYVTAIDDDDVQRILLYRRKPSN